MNYTPGSSNPYSNNNFPTYQSSSAGTMSDNAASMFVSPPSIPNPPNGLQMVNPPDIAMLARQGYLQQQQQLVNMGQYGVRNVGQPTNPMIPQMYGITPQMQQEHMQRQLQAQQQAAVQAQAQAQGMNQQGQSGGPGRKKRGPKPSAGAQMISRQTASFQPPHSQEHYTKNSMSASQSQPQIPANGMVPTMPIQSEPTEPWADALDELDPREIAMGRFRKRHEVLSEIFGPESLRDIPDGEYDPWAGLGMDGETLEAKVLSLEKENEKLEARSKTAVEDFKKRLLSIDAGLDISPPTDIQV